MVIFSPPNVTNKLRSFQNLLALSAVTLIITVWATVSFLVYQNNLLENYTNTNSLISSTPKDEFNKDDITNWKTYRNEEYGFEFKYPSIWENQSNNSEDVIFQVGEKFDGGEPGSASPLKFYASIKPFEVSFAQDIQNDGTEVINKESVIISDGVYNLETHKQFEVEAAYKIIDYISINNLKEIDIYLYFSHTSDGCTNILNESLSECLKNNENNIARYRILRNQILSTFKFLSSKSGWETFNNTKFPFTFKYPKDSEIVYAANIKTQFTLIIDDPKSDGFMNLWFGFTPRDTTLESYATDQLEKVKENSENILQPLEKTNINTLPALTFTSQDTLGMGETRKIIFVESPDTKNIVAIVETINSTDIQNFKSISEQILSTFRFLDEDSTVSPTLTKSPAKSLYYQWPNGWQPARNQNQDFEVGYNPLNMKANSNNELDVWIQIQRPDPFLGYTTYANVRLEPYDGGSRHNFIYKQLGYTSQIALSERIANYEEKNYTYNNWSCLVLYGLGYSAQGTTWGMCAVNSTQALFIQGPSTQEETENLIKTIKFLK